MALQIDRVSAEMQLLRRPDDASSASGTGGRTTESREELVRRLRPVVLEILAEHLRDLERRGVL